MTLTNSSNKNFEDTKDPIESNNQTNKTWISKAKDRHGSPVLRKSNIFPKLFLLMPWSQPPLPLNRMLAAGGRQRQWSRSVSTSRRSSQNIGTDASMSELASSDACFSQSTDGFDVAMADIEENVLPAGQGMMGSVSSELPPVFQLQLMFLVWEVR